MLGPSPRCHKIELLLYFTHLAATEVIVESQGLQVTKQLKQHTPPLLLLLLLLLAAAATGANVEWQQLPLTVTIGPICCCCCCCCWVQI
jgi:hypothetical protein